MNSTLRLMLAGTLFAAALAQDPQPPGAREEGRFAFLRRNADMLLRAVQQMGDWEKHYGLMMDSVERVYTRNGWDSEADAFSLSMIREVNAIPPWSPEQRFDKLTQIVSDRYLLDADQEALLRNIMLREATGLFVRHSDRIAQYAVEAIQTRAAGEPFTPEQVARWVQLAEPVFRDSRRSVNQATQELMSSLDPDQRQIVQADLEALNRRMDGVERMAEGWSRGQWQPSDWGLEDDPIQLGQESAASPSPNAPAPRPGTHTPPAATSPPRSLGHPSERATPPAAAAPDESGRPTPVPRATSEQEDAWAQYVRQFIRKFRLDDTQQDRAWRIYRDVSERRDRYRRLFAERLEAARRRASQAATQSAQDAMRTIESEQQAALRRLFDQLARRLDSLPTRAQRRDANPAALELPTDVCGPSDKAPAARAPANKGPADEHP